LYTFFRPWNRKRVAIYLVVALTLTPATYRRRRRLLNDQRFFGTRFGIGHGENDGRRIARRRFAIVIDVTVAAQEASAQTVANEPTFVREQGRMAGLTVVVQLTVGGGRIDFVAAEGTTRLGFVEAAALEQSG
jgi:hypothetical protein